MQHITDCNVDPIAHRASEEERARAQIRYLAIAGMGCPNCANRIRNSLLGAPGVVDVEVDLPAGLATVWHAPGRPRTRELLEAVSGAARSTHHRYLAVPVDPRS